MRKVLLLCAAMLLAFAAFSQSYLYQDDFESYNVGDYLALQNPTWWTTWQNLPGTYEDGIIDDAYASSPTKSVRIDETDGFTDLLLLLGDKTSGKYTVSFNIYVPAAYAGYYNFQHMESPGTEWALDVFFNINGTGTINAGGNNSASFNYTHDVWIPCVHFIDLDNDWAELYIDGNLIHAWQWSLKAAGGVGTKQLGSVDFFAGVVSGSNNDLYYVDDVTYELMPTELYIEDFESYNVDDYVALQNPTWWTTWSNLPGTYEDGIIDDAYSNSPIKSVRIDEKTAGASDLILKLGDKVSGAFDVNWYIYVPAGYAGYYNFQHFQDVINPPGPEWALQIYFNTDGTGTVHAGGENAASFDYTHDVWIPCEHHIDLDNDWAQLYIDGNLIHEWQWSLDSFGEVGTNQLGGVDFFAGAQGTDSPLYYFDDVEYIQTAANTAPIMVLTPDNLSANALAGTSTTQPLNIANDGLSDLEFDVIVIYDAPGDAAAPVTLSNGNYTKTLTHIEASTDPNAKPAATNPVTDDVVLHYDGDNITGISFGPGPYPITMKVGAMFPAAMTLPYAGMQLISVDMFIRDDMGTDFSVLIYDMGNSYGPGTLIASQPFSPPGLSWWNVELDNPVTITGADIWVAYQYTQPQDSTYIPGVDAGPSNPLGDFFSSGVGWTHLSSSRNWNIHANLTGTPSPQWLSVNPATATVAPGESADLTVTFDAAELEAGIYYATLRIISNDPENRQVDIPVTFEVNGVGTIEIPPAGNLISIYPNPAVDHLTIIADKQLSEVEIFNYTGQKVFSQVIKNNTFTVSTAGFSAGVYFVRVKSGNDVVVRKVTIQ